MLWTKQFYHYDVEQWLDGDPAQPPPPPERRQGRNADWRHLNTADVISMPDTWEYPWYAAWDLAFHCVPLALRRPRVRQGSSSCCCRASGTCTPTASSGLRVGLRRRQPARARLGRLARLQDRPQAARRDGDLPFLERVFHKLLLNFTWWVNRKDAEGSNVFQGGFLGLDNIGVFDRSAPLPDRRPHRAGRRHGWMAHVLPQHAARSPSSWRATTRPTRTSRPSSSSTSSTSPRP